MPIPATWSDKLLSVLRIVAGLAFLQHGLSKFFGFPPSPMPFPSPMPPILLASGTIELVAGALLVIGLFTRPVAFIASGMCAVGYFMAHAGMGAKFFPLVNGGETILLYCFIFLYLAAAGGGAWSADAAMKKA
ncbi:DoxX family protein [Sphingomonas sp. R-74633]|uniref:DoxX family protein n=1 Tax=Sphingomonas sp. R-74633 TaxID=2751188 RepID=UPI0015D33FD8|nr:DoxX family protein [Sphingomonas sp. R-74633]NYT39785.1 DoxX family protein [Sphingomonas sp. R-74633]